ncbi:MAG: D-glycero-beta-D-manno-heptose 1-phosphate adenylyltransferase [Thermoleophilia bacterium]|nr:D-glycero-beta-D-manno-heptose 1-phosphate adenylyltransferase [Thermoleophilia bacterium]
MKRPLVVVGDSLLDRDLEGRVERLCPEAPVPVVEELVQRSRPGGAALAAALAAADGRDVTLVTALAPDAPADELRSLVETAGVRLLAFGQRGATAEKVRVRSGGRLLVRLDHGGRRGGLLEAPASDVLDAIASASAVLVADYGRGVTREPALREALADRAREAPVVWDPHPRGPDPVPGAALVTPNRAEAAALVAEIEGDSLRDLAARADALRARWRADAVAITLASEGALLLDDSGEPRLLSAPPVVGGDPCGAGDRFGATAAGLLADRASLADAVAGAVRLASAFVAAGGAGAFSLEPRVDVDPGRVARPQVGEPLERLLSRVRAARGRVVATGGCFDLLHAGHVATLEAARALGDCLVVCLNSDDSVRRLKGPDRPLVPAEDRAAVLAALGCVDAVVVFDEDTPEAVLEELRPDVWAKGGDYDVSELPETRVVERWGGRAVVLPFLEGRSTTRLATGAARA